MGFQSDHNWIVISQHKERMAASWWCTGPLAIIPGRLNPQIQISPAITWARHGWHCRGWNMRRESGWAWPLLMLSITGCNPWRLESLKVTWYRFTLSFYTQSRHIWQICWLCFLPTPAPRWLSSVTPTPPTPQQALHCPPNCCKFIKQGNPQ